MCQGFNIIDSYTLQLSARKRSLKIAIFNIAFLRFKIVCLTKDLIISFFLFNQDLLWGVEVTKKY